ncbi:ATP-dependent helicase [Candidatus Kaiserbacteria bacterium]|nr:ATP-dependent helicase [Candidatus Kaiserbacteria bacterium]USN88893.1 MAG: ATP-dependent helicase [Candidatus Nomurabacteria bacterium]
MEKTSGMAAFKEAYASLNAAQKKAVDTIEGPVMVIAGPGTGKTQILTLRIANILLQTDVNPSNILAITFTDSGAKAMRNRLKSLIGDAAYEVTITTFHAFADSLVGRYPEAYAKIIGGKAASEIERVQIIEQILTDTSFKAVRPSGDPSYYVRPLLRAIQTLKQENVTPDAFALAIETQVQALGSIEQYHQKGAHKGKERGEYKDAVKHLERNQELLAVYRRYEELMRDQRRYDFDDMILETVHALETNEDMLRDLQEQYQYVLADEHQDVNGAQNKILELLVNFHDSPNIFVVGDEKQAIYRFQGASLENFLYFEEVFPEAELISLTENYRSGQPVLDAAQAVIATEDETLAKLRVPLTAAAVDTAAVELAEFPHTAVEKDWLVAAVRKDIESGIKPEEIALIVRTNREVEEFTAALRKKGVLVAPSADSDILEHPLLQRVLRLMRLLENPSDRVLLTEMLHEPYWQILPKDLGLVLQAVSRTVPLAELLGEAEKLTALGVSEESRVRAIMPLFLGLKKRAVTTPPHRLLELLLVESGLVHHVLQADPEEGVRVLRRLYDEVEGMVERREAVTLKEVAERFKLHTQYGVPLPAPFISYGGSAVQVLTAHKSKGLEYEVVYVPHATDKAWGAKTGREIFQLPIIKFDTKNADVAEEDERRLFYVAMTRAKRKLVFTTSQTSVTGKEQLVSRFIGQMTAEEIVSVDVADFIAAFSPLDSLAGVLPAPETKTIIMSVLDGRGFSPTALNNYLKSPWEYFFRNVLHVPQIKTTELQFGTAVHAVLDQLVRFHSSESLDEWLTKAPQLLRQSLEKEAISDEEYVRLHERGMNALVAYLPQVHAEGLKESKTEYHIEAVLETGIPEYPELKLNGNLDRVDFKDGLVTQVVDYKTGKPKTRNHIEGKTADSHGDYKRQLVFYALLLSLQKDTTLHSRTGKLSFVEADKNGVIKEEVFVITDEEIAGLKAELIRVTKEIVSGEALKSACDSDMCHYCDLVSVWVE